VRPVSHRATDHHRAGSRGWRGCSRSAEGRRAHRIDIESAMRAFLSREEWRDADKLVGNPYPSSTALPQAT
jgi:hypothetical protein